MVGPQADDFGDSHQSHNDSHAPKGSLLALCAGTVGVVFGDIGTSPIYAFSETLAGHHPIAPDPMHIKGVLREGGSLALLALINRQTAGAKWTAPFVMLGVFATALFYGDSMITPAMSILSAAEGLKYVSLGFSPWILPISVVIIGALFAFQSRGTAKVGAWFGPIMLVYFATLAGLGVMHLTKMPLIILDVLNPLNAFYFFYNDGFRAFVAMGTVVLAVTGAEALYADMGHFGRRPIKFSWLFFVLPALMLNYMGQGAMILTMTPQEAQLAIRDPFFLMVPDMISTPVIILTIMAAVIASQAVISGAFSLTQQAIQLGFMPRLSIQHTSEKAAGQIYIPAINWGLAIMVLLLVLFFQSSSNLAAAYGIAVTGAMFIDTCLIAVVLLSLWKWPKWKALPILGIFFIVDFAYFGANLLKVPSGGWVPLLIGLVIFTLLTTWSRGRALMRERMAESSMPMEIFIKSAANSATRVPGTAIFMASAASGVPSALLHNIKHNRILHERVIVLTVQIEDVPFVRSGERIVCKDLGEGFYRVKMRFGFLEETNVPATLDLVDLCGPKFDMMHTSFFLSRQTLIASKIPGMAIWREKVFAWMLRNAANAMEFFKLPSNRVVELGSQVEI